jgi:predicted ATPase
VIERSNFLAEAGRNILRQQVAIGGTAVHWADAVAFRELMLARGMADYERTSEETEARCSSTAASPSLWGTAG